MRLRPIVKQVLVAAACLALGGTLALGVSRLQTPHTDSLAEFVRVYDTADDATREQIAERYLTQYPAGQLLDALEAKYADTLCHTVAHPLGRAVYKRTQNFSESVQACGAKCSSGCFHGVLMQMFSTDSDSLGGVINDETTEDYLAHVQSVATKLCDAPEVKDVVRGRFCYHGLGHVFAYVTNEDLQKSISLCSVFPKGGKNTSCISGAFMEHLFSASSTAELNTADEHPCDAFPSLRSYCYRYKARGWIQVWGGAHRAMAHCDAFGANALTCIREIAYNAAFVSTVADEAGIEKLCGTLSGAAHDSCVDGALFKVIAVNDGDDTPAICDAVAAMYRDRCLSNYETFHGIAQ